LGTFQTKSKKYNFFIIFSEKKLIREEHRLRLFEIRVLKKILELGMEEVNRRLKGEAPQFILFTSY
jgi:hypothetical protein